MALRVAALTAIILVLVFLALTMAPTWSMAVLILFGMIAAGKEMRRNAVPAVYALAPDNLAIDVDALARAVDPAGLEMRRNPASAVDASALAVDAPAIAVDAPALAVDAAGKMRRNPESSPTSPPTSGIDYDVFLSYRGTDSRMGSMVDLYMALVHLGISVFIDDEALRVGEEMAPELKKAIERSKISIAIISRSYASSRWCLEELVQMWDCRKFNGQIVIPIFDYVSRSDVKNLAGYFGRALNQHEKRGRADSNTIGRWREALRGIGGLPGYEGSLHGRDDAQLINNVVDRVSQMLRKGGQVVSDKLVGIDLHVGEVMRKLGVAYSGGQATEVRGEDVRVVGICGVPGVGKTTLAEVVFSQMHNLFESYCFIEDIRWKDVQFSRSMLIADLQGQNPAPLKSCGEGVEEIASLCCNAKVLVVLDDVDKDEQIKALAGKLTWFGPGSRIIVTTNKREVLNAFEVGADDCGTVEEYEVKPLRDDHALQLFRNHDFQGDAREDVSEHDF